jgi:hypothetical protein
MTAEQRYEGLDAFVTILVYHLVNRTIHHTQVAWQRADPYNDLAGNGYCFVCGLEKAHPEAKHPDGNT